MDAVNEAVKALKQVTLKWKKDKGLAERVDSLTTTLRLLDVSPSTDPKIFEKLVVAFRQPFVPLYERFPLQTFQLSAAIFSLLFHDKIVMHLTAGNRVLQSSWEDVVESLLSGLLDFLEARSDDTTLRTLATALYPVLCRICFSTAFCSSITMGSTLRYTAFTLLVDSANEPTNKEMLRDPEYLGSHRLGATLYGSKDYVVLENLLLLVLIVAPKFEFLDKRSAFMREVFVTNCPEDTICGETLARILTKPTEGDSDLLQAQAVDILAKSNFMFPQPFDVTHIDSCGLRFPQTPPQQRLIVDFKSLLANVIKDEGYESFRVSFDQICGIVFSAVDKKSFLKVVVQLSSAPKIQSRPLKVPAGQSPSVMFEIRGSDASRFKRALRCRGIEGTPHISVSQEGHRLEFDREGNTVPEILASVNKVQTIERVMQLSQQSDGSPKDKNDQDREYLNEPLVSPLRRSSRTLVGIPPEVAVTSSSPVATPSRTFPNLVVSHKTQTTTKTTATLPNVKLASVTPRPMVPNQPLVFAPATPSQNKISHKDAFGSDDTDLSEPSDYSEADSMKALSQKAAARTNSMITITKRASVLADAVSAAGASGKKPAKRMVLDSDDEDVLLDSRKGAKGGSKPGASRTKKAPITVVVSDLEDMPPPPIPLKRGRPKPTKKNPGPLDEQPKPVPKRKREVGDDDAETGGVSDAQGKPPPAKRARKTAGGKPGATESKTVSPAPAPPRDSQVLKKVPPAKKNANYGGRTKAARTSSPTRGPPALCHDDDFADTLELKTRLAEPRVEPLDDGDDDYTSSPPAPPKQKPKSKPAAKPKPTITKKPNPPEKSKATAAKTKAKTQTGARTRAAAAKAKDPGDGKLVKVGPPQKTKAKAKKKPASADEEVDKGGEGDRGRAGLSKGAPVIIEVSSSPPEPPKAILPKRGPISRVISEEERVTEDPPKTEKPTNARSVLEKVVPIQVEEDPPVEEAEVITVLVPPLVRSAPTENRAKAPTKPISEQALALNVEQKQDDHASKSTTTERPSLAELCDANDSRLVEADSPVAASGGVDREVEFEAEAEVEVRKEAAVTGAQGLQDMDVEPEEPDSIVAKSPMMIQVGRIVDPFSVPVGGLSEPEELRPLDMNSGDGDSSEDGIRGFTFPQSITNQMPVGMSAPKERLEISTGMETTAQSTPAILSRGQQQSGRMTFRKPKVTFATTPLKEKEVVRSVQNETTPSTGAQRRTIFENDVFGTNSAWKRAPAKSLEKHDALVEVLNEIQDVIVKKITHQFEAAEEEAGFARNDVHNEALTDFKKMYSQRAVQFNSLVDLETAYATRERELMVAYEATLAVNAEILGHVRQKIREHDERNLVGRFPKTLRKNPMSALMNSYLK